MDTADTVTGGDPAESTALDTQFRGDQTTGINNSVNAVPYEFTDEAHFSQVLRVLRGNK